MGVISTRVASACSISEDGRSPQARATAMAGSARHHRKVAGQLTWLPARQRSRSTTSTAAARASSSHSVVGTRPACIMARVSAPKATNSPCGMKMMRVTENTSTRASAIRP